MERVAISTIVDEETQIFLKLQEFVERDGLITVTGIKRIRHGRNSQVFLIEDEANKWVVKKYHQHPKDLRNRLENETLFLSYLKDIGVKSLLSLCDPFKNTKPFCECSSDTGIHIDKFRFPFII